MKVFPKSAAMFHVPVIFIAILFISGFTVHPESQFRRKSKTMEQEPVQEIITTLDMEGHALEIIFMKGKAHNHPLMAIWIEDLDSNYIQTLYVAESIGKGFFRHGDPSSGRWMPGPVRRPAALPYWGHQRGVRADDGYYIPTPEEPMPDAITGATPKGSFMLHTQTPGTDLKKFRLLFEINQSWDWNEYWTNTLYPDDEHYMSSSQPALVYEVHIDLGCGTAEYELIPIGHSHWSGRNGKLYPGLHTLTTALNIAESIHVRIPRD